ncbi:MAG TPA: Fic family protein [Noviherbaspirillum sp.]|nr:Fic family protein [Noviherbaspirillum sp.]
MSTDDTAAKSRFDSLFYPGTQTLINFFGEKDPHKLAALERDYTMAAALDARLFNQIKGGFDLPHMQEIHKRLFGGIYPWAGQVRDFPLFKRRPDGLVTEFARPEEISGLNEQLREIMRETDKFKALNPEQFVNAISRVYQIANEMHAFREGNGRTHRFYLESLAEQAGYRLNFTKVDKEAWNYAASMSGRISLDGDERLAGRIDELQRVFRHIAVPIEPMRSNAYLQGREGGNPVQNHAKLTLADLNPSLGPTGPKPRLR